MKTPIVIALAAFLLSSADLLQADAREKTIRSHAEAELLSDDEFASKRPFLISGLVVATYPNGMVFFRDETGFFEILFSCPHDLRPGDVAEVTGHTRYKDDTSQVRDLMGDRVKKIGESRIPDPELTAISELAHEESKIRFVKARGVITDAFADEIDPAWSYLVLRDECESIHVALANGEHPEKDFSDLIDAEVEITGAAFPEHAGFRIYIGSFIRTWDRSCIRVLQPAPEDPFLLPEIDPGELKHMRPSDIATMQRCTARGEVLAVWRQGRMLIRDGKGNVMRVEPAEASPSPACGDVVKIVGYPETDLYRINMTRASFRIEERGEPTTQSPADITPAMLLMDKDGYRMVKPNFQGRLVRMRGLVRAVPAEAGDEKTILIESGKFLVPVDVSARPDIAVGIETGAIIDTTGVCVLESQIWRPSMVLPKIEKLLVVPRSAEDITIVSRPPWWTTGRLLALVGALVAALAAITVWNAALRHMARRAARELYRAEISSAAAELRIDERTRLAAELHDSLAQNLSGITMQITAANNAMAYSPGDEAFHLKTAEKMARSSLVELRRCIWDLRNDALEVADFSEAVRNTVTPMIDKTELHVSGSLPRARLNDSTAHALLQSVRELCVNASRHGKAANVWVDMDAGKEAIVISVKDDGSGFDIANHPGPGEGHFGLRGIRERARRIGGRFSIKSEPGKGTQATIEIATHGQKGDVGK